MPDARLKKIRFRASHRGFREADLILGGFAEHHLGAMTTAELDAFEMLIDQPDHDLYDWIVGQATAPAAFDGPVLAQLRTFHLTLGRSFGEAGGA
jgi:antitoxin CptB